MNLERDSAVTRERNGEKVRESERADEREEILTVTEDEREVKSGENE